MHTPPEHRRRHLLTLCILAGVTVMLYSLHDLNTTRTNLLGQLAGDDEGPVLGACTAQGEDSLFPINVENLGSEDDPGSPDPIDHWQECYHSVVETVIQDHLGKEVDSDALDLMSNCLNVSPQQTTSDLEIDCLSDSTETIVPAGELTKELASVLPPWNDGSSAALLRHDVGAVLLEYLRLYECALRERAFFRFTEIRNEFEEIFEREGLGQVQQDHLAKEAFDQQQKIDEQIALARPTLERALTMVSGAGRYSQLEAEVTCLQRISLDLRNAVALGAEAASCLPRVPAKDPLRDPR